MNLDNPLTSIKGVGDEQAKKFAVLGIETVGDLIDNFPRRYEDYSVMTPIARMRSGPVSIEAEIGQVSGRYVRRGMHITEAIASDATGSVRLVWFNQPYRAGALKLGTPYFISGQYELSRQRFAVMNPSVELKSDFPANTARILPVYRETKGLSSKQIRRVVREVVAAVRNLPETLPQWIIGQHKFLARSEAVLAMHFPENSRQLEAAKRRLGFEEVFELSLAALINKYEQLKDASLKIPFNERLAKGFVSHLPFKLTDAQRKVVWRIYQDMQKSHPMNRLVEGDVGSGKTVVAAMAAIMAMSENFQTALMAPTELLARQHAETIYKLLQPLGLHKSVALLVGGMKAGEKQAALEAIRSGRAKFMIGTHALIQESVDMQKLGLVIVDEQHRFGVQQRKKLLAKASHMPHVLSLTATPIPRSLALTLYGELDIAVLDEKPAGRQAIETKIVSPNSRAQLYEQIERELQAGRQMFVVTPVISDATHSAEKVYELVQKAFKKRQVGLLHGRMKSEEKGKIMEKFTQGQLDILVSTTVIEVGVDVPNASVMLIEAAERFGLAQIHQLRGRVGRGGHKGYCYLMMSDSSAPPKRLQALERLSDGFRLAELDLELRGPGAIYGTMQHGALDLRVANLTDTKLIAAARSTAQEFIEKGEDLLQYDQLHARVDKLRAVTNLN
jgi:ATP-dependent DNA helicase RecG